MNLEDYLTFLSIIFILGITALLSIFVNKRDKQICRAIEKFSTNQSGICHQNNMPYQTLYLPNLNIILIDIEYLYMVGKAINYKVQYANAEGKIETINLEDLDRKAIKLIEDELIRMYKEYSYKEKCLEYQQRIESKNKNHDLLVNMYKARLDSFMKEQRGE